MQAFFLCGQKSIKEFRRYSSILQEECVVITTDSIAANEIANYHKVIEVFYLDLLIDDNYEMAEEQCRNAVEILDSLGDGNNEYSLPLVAINTLYDTVYRVYTNTKKIIEHVINKYGIDVINLYYGSSKEYLLGINLAEAETPRQFMYKREWMLNKYVYETFKDKVLITWHKCEMPIKIKVIRNVRLAVIKNVRIIKTLGKIKTNRSLIERGIEVEKNIALFVVRTKLQFDALLSTIKRMQNEKNIKPYLAIYENYSNFGLEEYVKDSGIEYINLRNLLNKKDVCKIAADIHRIANNQKKRIAKRNCENVCKRNRVIEQISKELEGYWIESRILWCALERIKSIISNEIICILNNETHGWVAATEALWARKYNITSIGVPFVDLSVRPVSSWNDVYFLMSKEELLQMRQAKPTEKYEYSGPVAYDLIYNASKHRRGELKTICVFTQPDSFRSLSLRMVEDLIDIHNEIGAMWEVVVKLHPREIERSEFENVIGEFTFVRLSNADEKSTDLVCNVDLCLGISSNTLRQAIIAGTPVVSIDYTGMSANNCSFLKTDAICKLKNKVELKEYLTRYDMMEDRFYLLRETFIHDDLESYDGKGTERIVDYLKKKNNSIE